MTEEELETIAFIAMSELTQAFVGLRIRFSDHRDATYRVRVVQDLRDLRFRRYVGVAGESRAVSGFGGQGAVSFSFLASTAVTYAPETADRSTIIAAIGRGIEYPFAARPEQFYGAMQWDLAWAMLRERVGTSADVGLSVH